MTYIDFNLNSRPDWKLKAGDEFFEEQKAVWGTGQWLPIMRELIGQKPVAGMRYRRPEPAATTLADRIAP